MDTAAIAIISSYLMGSFPTAYIMGRLRKGIDIREVGSRNMGAANVIYQVGLAEGLLVLVVDVGKGAAAILLARWLEVPLTIQLIAGAAVVAGHIFSVFLKFRGGKGGAACVGALAVLMPQGIPIFLGIFTIALLISRYPTFSFSVSLLSVPFFAWLIYHSVPLIAFSVGLPVFVGINYIPGFKRMHAATHGNWRRIIMRKSLKERS